MTCISLSMRAWLAACALLVAPLARAGGGPENVFLIVNPRGAKSKEVANHYVQMRQIPPDNVYYLPLPPSANEMKALDFREKLLRPALTAIERRGLQDQIDYIVYSCEFPWRVDFAEMFPQLASNPQLRPMASLTGATFLHQFVNEGSDSLVQLHTNFYGAPYDGPTTASRAFRHKYQWGPDGSRLDAGGLQYYLSTQLGSTAPSGNSVEEILSALRRAADADGTTPPGTFYFMQNSDVRSRVRQPRFAAAVRELQALGLQAAVLNGVVPTGRADVAGLTTGAPQVPLRGGGIALVPGALVDNLTSQGAVLSRTQGPQAQTRVSEYIRLGAAGASGTVVEPFAITQKFPTPALHVHYGRGSSLAEAFYQSVEGPFQLLVVGDPLCQPWAAIPEVTVPDVKEGQLLAGEVTLAPTAKLAAGRNVRRWELFVDGKRREERPGGGSFVLDTTKLADGHHELRIVAIDDSPLEIQGRWVAQVLVKNGLDAVSLTAEGGPKISGTQLALRVTSTINGETVVFHNGREIGRVKGSGGKLTVPTEQLGRGPVMLEARTFTKPLLRSQPLRLEIE